MNVIRWIGVAGALLAIPGFAQQAAPVVEVQQRIIVEEETEVAPDRRSEFREAQRALEAATEDSDPSVRRAVTRALARARRLQR